MPHKIVFALTSQDRKGVSGDPTGFYLSEAAHPWWVLYNQGYTIDFVSPKGGKPPMDGADNPDDISQLFLENREVTAKLNRTPKPESVNPNEYKALLFVGGHGAMWDFPGNTPLMDLAASVYQAGGVVGAVCHGPAGLVNLKVGENYLVKGKRVAAFTDEEERAAKLDTIVPFLLATTLKARGAKHEPAPNWQPNVVVDGRLVTGQNPASAEGVGAAMADLLQTI